MLSQVHALIPDKSQIDQKTLFNALLYSKPDRLFSAEQQLLINSCEIGLDAVS